MWAEIRALACLLALSTPAGAESGLSQPVQLGQATLRILGFDIYTATLNTEGAGPFSWERPLSLRLDYARGFTAAELIEGTESELIRVEGSRPDQPEVLAKLAPCFHDVAAGDHYVAYAPRADQVEMRLNGRVTCTVTHPDLRRRFLGIWLSPESRSARLSAQLRGE